MIWFEGLNQSHFFLLFSFLWLVIHYYVSAHKLLQSFNVHYFLQVNLCLTNQTEKTVGPFEVFLAPSVSGEQKTVLVNGLQKLVSCYTYMLFNLYDDRLIWF